MEQRDYILREIEKIGAMIMGLPGKMIPMKEKGFLDEDEWAELNDTIKENLNFDLDRLILIPSYQLDQWLTRDLGFDENNIELLADLLVDMASVNNQEESVLKEKAIALYELANQKSKTFSMERAAKIRRLRSAN
jgi:hypothetical protein